MRNLTKIGIVVFLFFLVVSTAQAWWNASWNKVKPINIWTSTGYAGTGYQIPINITYDSDMQADFDDLRFTDNDNSTELSYWIESKIDNNWAYVWIEVNDNITSTNTTIWMWYDNNGASTTSSGKATMDLYDDFEDQSVNTTLWLADTHGSGGSYSETGGTFNLTASDGATGSASLNSSTTFTNDFIVEYRIYSTVSSTTAYYEVFDLGYGLIEGLGGTNWFQTVHNYGYMYLADSDSGCSWRKLADTSITTLSSGDPPNAGQWINYRMWYTSTGNLSTYADTGSGYSLVVTAENNTYLNNNKDILFSRGGYSGGNRGGTSKIEWVRVRKYPKNCELDQVLYSIGGEVQKLGGDVINPVVTLNSPSDEHSQSSTSVTFNCSAYDDVNLTNVSLYLNFTGSFVSNETNTSGINDTYYIFNKVAPSEGIYLWDCYAMDNASNTGTGIDRILIIDQTTPTVTLNSPANYVGKTGNISFNYTSDDISSLANCSVWINESGTWQNVQSNTTTITKGSSSLINNSGLDSGTYVWNVECYDSAGNGGFAANNRTIIVPDWWDSSYHYRVDVHLSTGSYDRTDYPVEKTINFTKSLADNGVATDFDNNSVRVIEWSNTTGNREINSQFDKDRYYNASNNAVGEVVWIMNGTVASGETKYYFIYFDDTDNSKTAPSYTTDLGFVETDNTATRCPCFQPTPSGTEYKFYNNYYNASHFNNTCGGGASKVTNADSGKEYVRNVHLNNLAVLSGATWYETAWLNDSITVNYNCSAVRCKVQVDAKMVNLAGSEPGSPIATTLIYKYYAGIPLVKINATLDFTGTASSWDTMEVGELYVYNLTKLQTIYRGEITSDGGGEWYTEGEGWVAKWNSTSGDLVASFYKDSYVNWGGSGFTGFYTGIRDENPSHAQMALRDENTPSGAGYYVNEMWWWFSNHTSSSDAGINATWDSFSNQITQITEGIAEYSSLDLTPPSIGSLYRNPSTPHEDQDFDVGAVVTDSGSGVSVCYLEIGGTNYTMSRSGDNCNLTVDNTGLGNYTAHDTVNYYIWGEDNDGNANRSAQSFTVANQVPSITTLSSPLNASNSTGNLQWSASTDDDDEDTVTYWLRINDSTGIYYQSGTTKDLTSLPYGYYCWNVTSTDTYANASTSDMWCFTKVEITYNVYIRDEMTEGLMNVSNFTSPIYHVYCSNQTSSYSVTSNPFSINESCEIEEIKLTVTHDGTTYFRTLIPDTSSGDLTFWMINISTHTPVELKLTINDLTGDFEDATVHIKKVISGSTEFIIDQDIDVESKVILWLIVGERYIVSIENDAEDRSMGYLLADTDTEKTITVSQIPFEPSLYYLMKDVRYAFQSDATTQTIRLIYNDTLNQTTSVNFYVYNATNISQLLYSDSSTFSNVIFTYNNVDINGTYLVKMTATHERYGSLQETDVIGFGYATSFHIAGLESLGIEADWYPMIALFFIIITAMLFSQFHAEAGTIVVALEIGLFYYWGWFSTLTHLAQGVVLLVVLVAFISKISEARRRK